MIKGTQAGSNGPRLQRSSGDVTPLAKYRSSTPLPLGGVISRLACGMSAVAFLLGGASGALAGETTSPQNLAGITERLDVECREGRFSGVVIIRVQDREVLEHVCGQADIINDLAVERDTRFKIYSTSKFITALTIMKLVELGQMDLDVPITGYVSDAPRVWGGVTIRMLLNHTSGFPDHTLKLLYNFRSDHSSAMRLTLSSLDEEEASLDNPPGSTLSYNNFGFELLADAAAQVAGRPFGDLVAAYVFQPAGMASASVEAPSLEAGHAVPVSSPGLALGYNGEPGALQQALNWAFVQLGAGAVHASADDFIALDQALKDGRILDPALLDEMTASLIQPPWDSPYFFGLGVLVQSIDGVRMSGHTGGVNGYISSFQRLPDHDAMFVVLSNRGFARTAWLNDAVADLFSDSPRTNDHASP